MDEMTYRRIVSYKDYFREFLKSQPQKVRVKIAKKNMKTKNKNITTLEELEDEFFGKVGTKERDEFEAGFDNFKIGFLLHEARKEKGLTQEELAAKTGTTKSYISKIENNVKEVRISTLRKIVEVGLGGKLNLSINL